MIYEPGACFTLPRGPSPPRPPFCFTILTSHAALAASDAYCSQPGYANLPACVGSNAYCSQPGYANLPACAGK